MNSVDRIIQIRKRGFASDQAEWEWLASLALAGANANHEVLASLDAHKAEAERLRSILAGEPTEAMMDAGDKICMADCHLGGQMREIWKAMAKSASQQQTDSGQ